MEALSRKMLTTGFVTLLYDDSWSGNCTCQSGGSLADQPSLKMVVPCLSSKSRLPEMKSVCLGMLLFVTSASLVRADEVVVNDVDSLRSALRGLKPGTTIKVGPGTYPGGYSVSGIEKLTIEALDHEQPPVIEGGSLGFHFSRCDGLTLRNLRVTGQRSNGINLDDGGDLSRPVVGITLDHVEVSGIGPQGNCDAIKCSGLDKVTIRDCTITGWGGQGIDFVGCHHSLITGCRFEGKEGFSASAGIQLKGGTSDILVEKCHFINAGQRPINLGGSTGMAYFRPQGVKYEAARLIVRHNVIEGSLCSAAFVGVDGAEFTGNTLRYPSKWIFRILQETTEPAFVPCRNVLINDNQITFRRSSVQSEINIGGGTAPETFRFEGNHWLAEDDPDASKPKLPTAEINGIYGQRSLEK
jgi:Right handed beta helix region